MNIVAKPKAHDSNYWIDEQIWGHRLYDEQTPWLTFLEFFNIFASELTLNASPDIEFKPQRQLQLRNIVFNNPHFPEILRDPPLPDDVAWKKWIELMEKSMMQGSAQEFDANALRELSRRIPQFADFEKLVRYLRRTSIEGNSNKRWSSKFVFPFGVQSLYEDLRVSDTSASNDRRFFARTGELLYMMLSRSKRGPEIAQMLQQRFFQSGDPTDTVIGILQGKTQRESARGIGYLPYVSLPEYDALADDWMFLLGQNLPKFDVLPHLVLVTGLHLLIYFLRQASAVAAQQVPTFVCEIVAPRRTAVRDIALRSFETNQALPRAAIETLLRSVTNSDAWKAAVNDPEPLPAAARVLCGHFDWPSDEELHRIPANYSPEDLLKRLTELALVRHRQHVAKIHGSWARHIGLSSRRGSQRVRYAPTDALLKSLVFANVRSRMEFKEFLRRLHERYGFVIGEHQAGHYIDDGAADLEDFAENATRLEERLTSLGLMNRLSDGCAYVQLPFAARARHG